MQDKLLWRILIGAGVSIAICISGWTLNAVANMPKEYVLRDDFKELRTENREDHKDIMKAIRELMNE